MRRFLPKSLAGQTILVLLIGLIVSHFLSMLIFSGDRADALTLMGEHNMARRMVKIALLASESPVERRDRIVAASTLR